jgi:L-lactate dehydrogenase
VIGEHGDSQCIAWSTASVSGIPLAALLPLSNAEKASIAEATKRKAYEIIASKGFTSYGIGAVTASICEAIISEQGRIFPVCHWQEAHGCCFSLPAVVGRGGVVKSVELPLNEEEKAAIQKSAEEMRGIIEKMKETKG